jgi:peptide deformylase/transcriptional regulator with XRE-family HTH domain
MTNPLVDKAADAFAATLVDYRGERGMSKKQLAAEMGFDPSYVSHVEARRHRPTEDFARRAEAVLRAGGVIWQRFREYDDARVQASGTGGHRHRGDGHDQWVPPSTTLLIEHEHSYLTYVDGSYRCVVRRELFNAGSEPVTRYLVRISVDRYPGETERSNRHYRDHPLTWAELNLQAHSGDELMTWRAKLDRDALKEVWLLFENEDARFPLYPGQRATIEYAFTVGEDKWGHWFQRAVRLPTRRLSVHLDFPSELTPVVWGVETSMTAEAGPLKTPVTEVHDTGRTRFDWSTEDPQLNARFRLEWRFRNPEPGADGNRVIRPRQSMELRPSERMKGVGIVQRGAPVLDRAARWFELPEQAPLASDIVSRLLDVLQLVGELHHFTKGMGLAAPQLGIGWAAAIMRPPGGQDVAGNPIVLLNPRVVGESVDRDEQYEGCLSFFDVRGMVSRPLLIEIEHSDLSGNRTITTFLKGMARLALHEVDHLGGLLYTDRMSTDGRLVPVEEYESQPWRY